MKVLYITYDGLTDPLGQSQIIPYITSCSSSELTFHVVSFEKKNAFEQHFDHVRAKLDRSKITWTHHFYTKRPALISSVFDLFTMIRTARHVVRNEKIDLIHCRGYVPAYAAFILKKKLGTKVLFDMRGFWADERMEGNIWNPGNILHRRLFNHIKKKEKLWWREADHMISLTQAGARTICLQERSVSNDKITIIPCCADEHLFSMNHANDGLREQLGLTKEDRVLIYVGSLGTWYMSEEMMAQFSHLYKKGRLHHFMWITKEDPEHIMNLARKEQLPESSVSVHSANRDEVASFMATADLGIFYIRPTFSKKASSPTKLGEMLLSGLPVIANSGVGDLDQFFTENDVGFIHDIENESTFNIDGEVIDHLLTMSKSEIRNTAIQYLSLNYGVSKYLKVYTSLK